MSSTSAPNDLIAADGGLQPDPFPLINWRLVAADAVERAPLGELVEALVHVHGVTASGTPVAL